jgi:Hemerythrin HHE cation binding domain
MPSRIHEVTSKVVSSVKGAKARHMQGVFLQLTKEHGEAHALLMRIASTSDVRVRRDLFPRAFLALMSHEIGEIREVYPAFEKHPELARMAAVHDGEAEELQHVLNELGAMPYEDEAWGARFAKMVDLVSHHVSEEERAFFPAANRILGKAEAERLLTSYLKTKADAIQQMTQNG